MSQKSVQASELREHLVINMRDFRLQRSLEDGTGRLSRNLDKELPLLNLQVHHPGCVLFTIK